MSINLKKNDSKYNEIVMYIFNMDTRQMITIDGEELNYKEYYWYGKPYIVSYMSEYPENVKCHFNQIADLILNQREYGRISANSMTDCNKNAQIILGVLNLKQRDEAIIIGRHVTKQKIVLSGSYIDYDNHDELEDIYGSQLAIMGLSFHALSYISFALSMNGNIHIAVDTTTTSNCDKYFIQMYIGRTPEELEKIIRLRYRYTNYNVCDIYDHPGKFN